MKCGTAEAQQSSALSGTSELIPLLFKRCPGVCQDSHRWNTGTSDRERSQCCWIQDWRWGRGVSSWIPSHEHILPFALPLSSHPLVPLNPICQTSPHTGLIRSSFVCCLFFSKSSSQPNREAFPACLLALLLFLPLGPLGPECCPELLTNNTSCPQQESVCPDGDIHLAAGEGSELSIFQGSASS